MRPSTPWAGGTRCRTIAPPRWPCSSRAWGRPLPLRRRSTCSWPALWARIPIARPSSCRPSAVPIRRDDCRESAAPCWGWPPRRSPDATGCSSWPPARARARARARRGSATWAVDPGRLQRRPVHGLDPALGLFEVTGAFDTAEAEQKEADWPAALALGQLALGHELVGAGRTMLELARTHALERVQFGRPIGTFQAVRHRLADSLVALEAADALLQASWDDPSPVTAAMAKAFAGRSARVTAAPLPAGAGRDRLHHRAPAALLHPTDRGVGPITGRRQLAHPAPGRRHFGGRRAAGRLPPLTSPAGRRRRRRRPEATKAARSGLDYDDGTF